MVVMNSVVVVSVLNCAGFSTMMCLTLPRLLYVYIGILTKPLSFQPISLHSDLCMSIVVALLELVMMHLLK